MNKDIRDSERGKIMEVYKDRKILKTEGTRLIKIVFNSKAVHSGRLS